MRAAGWTAACGWLMAGVATLSAAAALSGGRAASLPVGGGRLTVVRTCELTGYPSSTTAVADASVRQDRSTTNYAGSTTLGVRSAASANRRAYLRYDLAQCSPGIPSSASVKNASLRLSVTATGLPATCRTEDVYRVAAPWSESTITWANQPASAAGPTSAVDFGVLVGCTNHAVLSYVAWDVTADVQAFVAGAVANYGWVVRDRTEGSVVAQIGAFASKNGGVSTTAPLLTVTWMA